MLNFRSQLLHSHLFSNLVAKRYERGSMVLTSKLLFTQWAGAFADDQTPTAAMVDRLLHHAHIVQIAGQSFRLKDKRKADVVYAARTDFAQFRVDEVFYPHSLGLTTGPPLANDLEWHGAILRVLLVAVPVITMWLPSFLFLFIGRNPLESVSALQTPANQLQSRSCIGIHASYRRPLLSMTQTPTPVIA